MKFYIVYRQDSEADNKFPIKSVSQPFQMEKYALKNLEDQVYRFIGTDKGEGSKQIKLVRDVINDNLTVDQIRDSSLEEYPCNHYAIKNDDGTFTIYEKYVEMKEIEEDVPGFFSTSKKIVNVKTNIIKQVSTFGVTSFNMDPLDFVPRCTCNQKQENLNQNSESLSTLENSNPSKMESLLNEIQCLFSNNETQDKSFNIKDLGLSKTSKLSECNFKITKKNDHKNESENVQNVENMENMENIPTE